MTLKHWGLKMNAEALAKCLPAVWETGVRSLGQEDPLEMVMVREAWRVAPGP